MRRMLCAAIFLALAVHVPFVSAQDALRGLAVEGKPIFKVRPRLAQEETRQFAETSLLQAEKTQLLEIAASDLILEYSSEEPFEVRVSYLNENPAGGEGAVNYNPYHTIKVRLEPQSHGRVSLDLTRSPAWSPFRDQYLLHVFGVQGQVIEIFDLAIRPPTFLQSIGAAFRHINLDEPTLLSSINFLWGYRVLDIPLTVVFGVILILVTIGFRFQISGFRLMNAIVRSDSPLKKSTRSFQISSILLFFLLTLFLYDARFSFNLVRTTVADLRQWYGDYQYRQLGPVHAVADYLATERARFGGSMKVAVCYDGTDFLEKQLRYMLYPTPVDGVEDLWGEATHAVFMDTERGNIEEGGTVSCGENLRRPGRLLRSFSQNSRVVRF
jgi:hypothetical protein